MLIRFGEREVDAAKLLVALYNNTQAVGLGRFNDRPNGITLEEAQLVIDRQGFNFDYVAGRPIKVISRDGVIDEQSIPYYDRDAGEGKFLVALEEALDS